MPVARTRAVALVGMRGAIVEVEADLTATLPGIVIIGLADTALGEARERVRSAAANSGSPLPARRITVNLSPADLPKNGSGFDLAVALAALAAAERIPAASVAAAVHIGELGLDGRVRQVSGVLPAVMAARDAGADSVMVPMGNAREANLVAGIRVIPVTSLHEAAVFHGAKWANPAPQLPTLHGGAQAESARAGEVLARAESGGDLADVIGNQEAVEALIIAAAGRHHLFMVGPPGAGKTMLASRLPGILPDLDPASALEVACIRSLGGRTVDELPTKPPFEAPHHTATAVSLVGGGSTVIRPGAISRAAHGVLFLDEAPEMSRVALDALRQPLESGTITIHRGGSVASFPANPQLILAANPCPCGRHEDSASSCTCTPMLRRRYLGRLSGPLLDRVDLRIHVRRVSPAALVAATSSTVRANSSAMAADRISKARAAALERLGSTPWRSNSEVPGSWLRGEDGGIRLPRSATSVLDRAFERGSLSLRGYIRLLRVGWTIADLEGADSPRTEHLAMALGLRSEVMA